MSEILLTIGSKDVPISKRVRAAIVLALHEDLEEAERRTSVSRDALAALTQPSSKRVAIERERFVVADRKKIDK